MKKQTQLCNPTGILDNCKLTVQKYKGRGCCQLNCAKVQGSSMLQTQLCTASIKVVDGAISLPDIYVVKIGVVS